MTAPSIITDAEAREIAETVFPTVRLRSGPRKFRDTGAISAVFAQWGRSNAIPEAGPDVSRLAAYVAYHGERPAVDGWSEL